MKLTQVPTPFGARIIVRFEEQEQRTAGGLVLPDGVETDETAPVYVCTAVGFEEDEELIGRRVFFEYPQSAFKVGEVTYGIVSIEAIHAHVAYEV